MSPAPRGGARLEGRRALVTGASSGIGAATARLLAERGARVAISGRDAAALEGVAAACGPAAVSVAADLTEPGAPARVVAGAAEALGGLDVVVANAGAGWAGPFGEMTEADIDALVDLNLRSTAHLLRAAVGRLEGGGGHLVVVGSVAGLLPVREEALYSATKAALAALSEALRSELAGSGVGVSLVSPGVVDTSFFSRRNRPYARSRPRPIPAGDVAAAVVSCLGTAGTDRLVPGWLALPVRVRAVAPTLYRRLASRFG